METKQKWLFLFFALLSASLYGDVAGRLVQGPSHLQYAIYGYSENNQEGAHQEIPDYKMTTFFTAMEKFTESVDIKLDSIISHQNDLKQNIKEIIKHLVLKQTTNISLCVTEEIDTLFKKKNAEIVKIIDLEFKEMKDFMRDTLAMLIQSQINLREEIKELADKVTLFSSSVPKEETTMNSKIMTSAESVEMTTEKKFVKREIKSSEQPNNEQVSSTSGYIKETEYKKDMNNEFKPIGHNLRDETEWSSEDYDLFEELMETTTDDPNVIKDIISSKQRSEQAESIKANYTEESEHNYTSLCDLVISSSIENTEQDVWEVDRKPKLDDLDLFVIAQTGCTYTGLRYCEEFYTPPLAYDGSPFEWRGALRTANNGGITVQWGSDDPDGGYAFSIGVEGNRKTEIIQRSPSWKNLESRPTPGILSSDRYVPFYIKIREGVMTFGQECESEPMFTNNVTIKAGEPVYVSFYPFTPLGGKHLFHCPPAAGVPTVKE